MCMEQCVPSCDDLIFIQSFHGHALGKTCGLQTTIDFPIHLSYKTGQFRGLYKIP